MCIKYELYSPYYADHDKLLIMLKKKPNQIPRNKHREPSKSSTRPSTSKDYSSRLLPTKNGGGGYWTLHLQTLLLLAPPAKIRRWRVRDPPPPNITPRGSSRLKTEGLVKVVLDPPPPNITPPGSSR